MRLSMSSVAAELLHMYMYGGMPPETLKSMAPSLDVPLDGGVTTPVTLMAGF